MVQCHLCNTESKFQFNSIILKKYNAEYYLCPKCGYLFISDPFWLEEAYKSPINDTDTGILSRNLALRWNISPILYFFFGSDSTYVDYGGGYGIFTRLMRDIGFNYLWYDPYCKNIFAKGFEYSKDSIKPTLVTCFECFEHLNDPMNTISNISEMCKNIIFTTELLPGNIPNPDTWWYYGLEHGQHISFYQKKTLIAIARKLNLNFYSNGIIHLFTEQNIPNYKFKIISNIYKYGGFKYVSKKLSSKTFSDMMQLKNK